MSTFFLTKGEKDTENHKQLAVRVVDGYVKVSSKSRFWSMGNLSSIGSITYEGDCFKTALDAVNYLLENKF